MSQSKRHSRIEVFCNVFSGMLIAFIISQLAHWLEPTIQEYIWSDFVWKLSFESNLVMTTILTIVSLLRGYLWRRIFNHIQKEAYK